MLRTVAELIRFHRLVGDRTPIDWRYVAGRLAEELVTWGEACQIGTHAEYGFKGLGGTQQQRRGESEKEAVGNRQ